MLPPTNRRKKRMENKIAIYQDGSIKLTARVEDESIWLTQAQIVELFGSSKANINEHINKILQENELDNSVVRNSRTTASNGKNYNTKYYNLGMIISIGYRVKSKIATQFRKWVTQTLRDYITQGYAINEQRLREKESQLETLKKAIDLLEKELQNQIENIDQARQLTAFLSNFAKGFELLDDYDHQRLDQKGKTKSSESMFSTGELLDMIKTLKKDFDSDVFGLPKDESFESSINQIYQTFGNQECYPSIEEKAVTLLYLVVKNHSFIDGNKRIAAACFLYFLDKDGILKQNEKFILDNNSLFALTILVAESKPSEMEIIKSMIVSILNRSETHRTLN